MTMTSHITLTTSLFRYGGNYLKFVNTGKLGKYKTWKHIYVGLGFKPCILLVRNKGYTNGDPTLI